MSYMERIVSLYLDYAESEYEKYRIVQDRLFVSDYDKFLMELEEKEKAIKEALEHSDDFAYLSNLPIPYIKKDGGDYERKEKSYVCGDPRE